MNIYAIILLHKFFKNSLMKRKNVIILGAAGRDFHNFNTYFRNREEYNVVAFTAAQIPNIDGRKYPAELAGTFYPEEFRFILKVS